MILNRHVWGYWTGATTVQGDNGRQEEFSISVRDLSFNNRPLVGIAGFNYWNRIPMMGAHKTYNNTEVYANIWHLPKAFNAQEHDRVVAFMVYGNYRTRGKRILLSGPEFNIVVDQERNKLIVTHPSATRVITIEDHALNLLHIAGTKDKFYVYTPAAHIRVDVPFYIDTIGKDLDEDPSKSWDDWLGELALLTNTYVGNNGIYYLREKYRDLT
jgi:hypothetical protein